ncbi:dimethylsulfonioproprionate lyase family protein [Phenylobacterium sp.]|uniref:dimethylsulfonioproprionate lyase family protein n=1 Tax=Phenylobacterium sp. TaxID=1871053 RepID=UPI0025ECF789|nr:dimethylsulfonioproprionate lyase family protein [Phenylobacterium sp.]
MAEPLPFRLNAALAALRAVLAGVAADAPILPPAGPLRADLPAGSALDVLRRLPAAAAGAPSGAFDAVARLAGLAGELRWRQTYGSDEADEVFLANYGWTELAGTDGLVADPAISAGLLLLGPQTLYPAHSHPAVERYVPLSGAAEWWDEDRGWRLEPPLSFILHRAGVRHAMRTGREPLLAYFHWSGPGISERSRFSAAPFRPTPR